MCCGDSKRRSRCGIHSQALDTQYNLSTTKTRCAYWYKVIPKTRMPPWQNLWHMLLTSLISLCLSTLLLLCSTTDLKLGHHFLSSSLHVSMTLLGHTTRCGPLIFRTKTRNAKSVIVWGPQGKRATDHQKCLQVC